MRLIDKLVLKELVGPFINGVFMFVMLVFAAGTLFQATQWIVQGVPVFTVLKLVLLNLPEIITQVFPMAMLLAGLMGFGQLSTSRETVAIFAAGISFPRTARPVVMMGLVVTFLAFLWNDYVVPPCTTAYWNLYITAVKKQETSTRPITFVVPAPGDSGLKDEDVTISGGLNPKNKVARNVSIIKYNTKDPRRLGEPVVVIYCDHAKFHDQTGKDATYYNGWFIPFTVNDKTGTMDDFIRTDFSQLTVLPSHARMGGSLEDMLKKGPIDNSRLSFQELKREIRDDRKNGYDTRQKEFDLYGKFALPLASLIFGLVGAALGCNTQRGAGKTVGFGLAIFIVFLYWMLYHSMSVVAANGGLQPLLASFMTNIVGAAAGLILAVRASR